MCIFGTSASSCVCVCFPFLCNVSLHASYDVDSLVCVSVTLCIYIYISVCALSSKVTEAAITRREKKPRQENGCNSVNWAEQGGSRANFGRTVSLVSVDGAFANCRRFRLSVSPATEERGNVGTLLFPAALKRKERSSLSVLSLCVGVLPRKLSFCDDVPQQCRSLHYLDPETTLLVCAFVFC
jgi:hypothetical protein